MFHSWRPIFVLVFAIGVIVLPTHTHAEEKFYILVNKANEIALDEKMAHQLIRRLYLQQQTSWPQGEKVIFFARRIGSSEEIAFRTNILSMTDTQFDDYWIKMKQTRGVTPPREVSSTRILLRQLQSKPTAVGIFSMEDYVRHAKDDPRIKILTSFTGPSNE